MDESDPALKSAAPAPGRSRLQLAGRALFLLHLALFIWWAFRQAFARVAPRAGLAEPTLAFDIFSLGLMVVTLLVITQLARALEGSRAEGAARLAILLAVVDVVGQLLQLAPQLGLPTLFPAANSLAELGVRGAWVSCEFGLRAATFWALWRCQRGAAPLLAQAFFCLLGVQWLLVLVSFTGGTTAFAAAVDALPGWWLARRAASWLSFTWLAILVSLSRRVARG